MRKPSRHLLNIVLYQPDIPQNTGNIGRTCVAVGAKLWLIRPLGFHLDAKHLRRSGMDYWRFVDWEAVDDLREIQQRLPDHRWWYITKFGRRPVWEAEFGVGDVVVFGSETRGLPEGLLQENTARTLQYPMREEVRSLNLASTATAVIYEAVRQFGGLEGNVT